MMSGVTLNTVEAEPTLEEPVCQPCTYDQVQSPLYARWCAALRETPRPHRKQWEFVYILQALSHHGFLEPGFRGLGFGVGTEPLSAFFAAQGLDVVATDMASWKAVFTGWRGVDQHAHSLDRLNDRNLCDPDSFARRVRFRTVDMKKIPADLRNFDFTWSACALEHLGSIPASLRFVMESLETLRPGGIAVHTTELNCKSNDATVTRGATVLLRRRDFERLFADLRAAGHTFSYTFHLGNTEMDRYVDVPPYSSDRHLRLKIKQFTTTSYGLIIRKKGD